MKERRKERRIVELYVHVHGLGSGEEKDTKGVKKRTRRE